MIRAGQLRDRIVIQQFAVAQNTSGEQIKTWTVFKHRDAMVAASRGKEQFDLAHTKAEQVVKFVLRYTSGVTEQMRILYGGSGYADGLTDAAIEALGYRIYSINSVVDVHEKKRRHEIMTTLERK